MMQGAAVLTPDDHILENGGVQVRLGLDLTKKQKLLDSLTIEAGDMITFARVRGIDGWQTVKGICIKLLCRLTDNLAILNEFYDGQPAQSAYLWRLLLSKEILRPPRYDV